MHRLFEVAHGSVRLQRVANAGTVYAIGGVASFWVVERVAGFW